MNTKHTIALALAMLGAIASGVRADAPTKYFAVEPVVNNQPAFMVVVDVDSENRVYREGELMNVRVKAERDCYVYLLYYHGEDATMLFPNSVQSDNFVPANTPVQIPGEGAEFQFRTVGPFGEEMLQVVASAEPIDPLKIGKPKSADRVEFKSLQDRDLKQMVVDIKKQKQSDWAEARIGINTIGKEGKPPKTGKRVGVAIGISKYQHDRIPQLQVSHLDAERMAEAFKSKCQLDEVLVLTNEQATYGNIEKAIFHDLVAHTQPGDTVFIFFSGHGGRCADQNGDEDDGYDEYLVPHDGILGKPETMILDDTFARWLQELSGREVALVMDNCYSGGASKSIDGDKFAPKSVSGAGGANVKFDGMEVELRRSKDLGQANTMVLAACKADQKAWEMPTSEEGSVLTHYLLEALDDPASDANQDGNLSLQEAFKFVQEKVQTYVTDTYKTEQTPVIVDNAQDAIIFKHKQ